MSAQFSFALREKGTVILRARFCLSKEDAFAALLAAACEKWARTALYETAKAAYDADETPKKRFYFVPFEYAFEAKTEENIFFLQAMLRRGGEVLVCYEERIPVQSGLFGQKSHRFAQKNSILKEMFGLTVKK